MKNKFIYSPKKSLFEKKLAAGEIGESSIVFIEDTKEIWNRGHYFGMVDSGSGIDPEVLSGIETAIATLQSDKADKSELSDYALKSELPSLDGYLTKIVADSLYATIAQYNTLNQTVGDIQTELSNKATKDDLSTGLAEKLDNSAASGFVPTTRKVNGKALDQDITITATDPNAATKEELSDVNTDLQTFKNNVALTYATDQDVADAVASLVDSSPAALDTLNELAAALGDDPNFATTVATNIGKKADQTALDTTNTNVANLTETVNSKVDKVSGKGLSTNDFTNDLKTKLDGIADGAEVNVQSDWNATSGDALILNKPTIPSVGNGTITITQNGTTMGSFTMNQSGDATIALTDTTNIGTITEIQANGTSIATSGVANIPAATTSKYGVTKLSSSTNSTSTTLAATPNAVRLAYNKAVQGVNDAATALSVAEAALPKTGGTMNGKIIMGGVNSSSSPSSTSQIVWGSSGAAISSNGNNVIINPSSSTTTGQIIITPGSSPSIKVDGTNVSLDGHSHSYLPLSGGTLTGPLTAKGEQYDGNYGLNMANSDIIGVNSIIMSDEADSGAEGIRFINGSTHDSIWAKNGVMYFTPQMGTDRVVVHSGNISSYAITSLSGYATQSWVQSQGYKTTDNNTLNTAGSTNSTSKLYLIGAGSQATSATTYSNSSCYMQSGYLYATSDERLKNFENDITIDFNSLKSIPKKYFRWKENPENLNIGTSAQALQKVYPELVTTDENGEMGVNYQHLSIVALAAIDKLHEENLELKERIERLESKIK